MAFPSVTYSITNNTPNDGSQVAQNFSDCINAMKDGTKDFNVSAFTSNGNTTLGASGTNTVTFNGSLASTIAINANTTYNVGSSTKGLATVYFGGTSTFTIGLAAPILGASYSFTLPTAVPSIKSLLTFDTTGALASGASLQTTSPAVNRYQFAEGLQPSGSGGAILSQFSSSARTLQSVDSTTGTGKPLVSSAAPTTHGLHIVRGAFTGAAGLVTGEGWSVAKNSTGNYTVTYGASTFFDAPVVVGSALGANCVCTVATSTTASINLLTWTDTTGASIDTTVYFIAIGQRST